MSDYTKTTNFTAKDALPEGNAAKKILGSLFDTEFDNIATAVATKADLTSATLVTPDLGTPSAGTLTNCTGLPVSTGISGLGTNVGTFLATPSSANLLAAVTDETGTGALVFANSPTLVTPALGTPASGVLTNCTGTAAGLTAGAVTTNANLTGEVTSSGNAASVDVTAITNQSLVTAVGADTVLIVDATDGALKKALISDFASSGGDLVSTNNLSDLDNASTARTNLGVAIGTDVQAYDADLAAIAALAKTDSNFIVGNGSAWVAESGATAAASMLSGASLTSATVATGDKVLVQDADASDALKTVTAQSIADLASSGGMVWLASITAASDATIDFEDATAGVFDGTYDQHLILFYDVIPATDNVSFQIRTSSSGTYDSGSTDYAYSSATHLNGGTSYSYHAGTTGGLVAAIFIGSDTNETGVSGALYISGYDESSYTSIQGTHSVTGVGGEQGSGNTSVKRLSTTAVDGIRFFFSSGDVESGKFAIYGIKRS